MSVRCHYLRSTLLLTALLGSVGEGLAAPETIDEIIVTARRVPERLRDVPLTINAFGRDDIGVAGIDSLQTLIARTPGLYFESAWGGLFATPSLRGQQLTPDGDLKVGVFVDGVYQANQIAVDTGAMNVERIEVVRGPQSTLYGHSTFAGAIHYVSHAPPAEPLAGATVDIGSDQYLAATAFLSGPLSKSGLRARLATGAGQFDGTESNGVSGGGLGGWDRAGVSLIVGTAAERILQAALHLRYSEFGSTQPAASALTHDDYNCGAIEAASGAWSYYCGAVPIRQELEVSRGLPDSGNDVEQAALSLSWPALGGQLESQTSYYRGNSDSYRDFDLSRDGELFGVCTSDVNCVGPIGIPRTVNRLATANEVSRVRSNVDEWTQEFRWRGANERAHWMIGAVAWWTKSLEESRLGVARGDLNDDERYSALLPIDPYAVGPLALANFALVIDPNLEQITRSLDTIERRTLAVFASFDYALSAKTRARAELRATRERRELDNQIANFLPGFGKSIPAEDFDDLTPRFSLQFAPAETWSGYLSAAKGSQSGGINPVPGLSPDEQAFDPEYNWTYELSGRYLSTQYDFETQITLYYVDWRDAQMFGFPDTPGITNLITRNTKGIITRGMEVSLRAPLLRSVRAELDYSYTDPEFRAGSDDPGSRRFCGLNATSTMSTFCTVGPAREGSATALVPYVDGNLPHRTPQSMWHAALVYELARLPGDRRLTFRVDANGQDDVFDRAINGARFGSRTLLDARLSYVFDNWSVALWGRNLGDERYVRALASRGQVFFPTTPRPLDMIYSDGRRIGLSISFAKAGS
ncbi:MAG: TonB-dependent receptor [Gammaproteobacteria bacterium]|nr:TonB-dependent receptor [Gammaproteobacteria bacterium]